MKIEFLYTPGCSTEHTGCAFLVSVLREAGLRAELQLVPVTSADQAAELGFPGSPTFRIDGCDVDPAVTAATPSGLG